MTDAVLYVSADDEGAGVLSAVDELSSGALTLLHVRCTARALRLLREHKVVLLLCSEALGNDVALELLERAQREFPEVLRGVVRAAPRPELMHMAQLVVHAPVERGELAMQLREVLARQHGQQQAHRLTRRLAESERVYALGVVAGGVAHELRNPIAAVATSLSLLRDGLSTLQHGAFDAQNLAHEPFIDVLQEMVLTVADARQGIQGIADISRGMELSQRRRDSEDQTDLSEVARLTIVSLHGALLRRCRLTLAIEPTRPARGARAKLSQVVLNMVVHALQSLPDDGAREHTLHVALRDDGEQVRFELEDNAPHERGADGADLLLDISRQALHELGGSLAIQRAEQGRRFSALFPATQLVRSANSAA